VENYLEQIKAKSADLYHRMEYPGASDILIGQVRHLIQQSSLTPFYNGNRFALISPAEKMNKESQNSLLKLLEEAPANFYICLVTSNPEQILPTIASRCQEFYFPPLSEGDIIHGLMEFYNCSQEKAQFATDRADGSFVKAVEIFKQGDPTREIAFDNFLRKQVVMKDLNNLIQQMHNSKEWNRREMRDILLNVDHWLRDVMMMDCGLKPKYFADKKENLDKFQSDIKYSNLLELRKDLWQSVDLIEKNVYIDLIYINLVQAFQKALIWTKRK
jgi:DNA polymerase-3 subunit delta'